MRLEKVEYFVEDNVGYIVMDYMKNFNAIDVTMAKDVLTALTALEADDTAKVIVLKGQEKAFSAGGDIGFFYKKFKEAAESDGGLDTELTLLVGEMTLRIKQSPKIVITSVSGAAAGAGANLALSGDLVICSETAMFLQAFSKLGLAPDTGGAYLLANCAGPQVAMEYCLFAKPMPADVAKKYNLVYKVVPAADLDAEVAKVANFVKTGPLVSFRNIKQQIVGAHFNHYRQYLKEVEFHTQVECGNTLDFKEGTLAFVEKRKADFQGK